MSGRSNQIFDNERHCLRRRQRCLLFRIAIGSALFAMAGMAQAQSPCGVHYPFDGALTDATGNGYDGSMISKSGGSGAPQFVAGRFGQALHVDGNNAMRSYLDLHYDVCPQFTITAWFQLPSVEFDARQFLVSTGERGGIPGIAVHRGAVALYGQANGLSERQAVRDGNAWHFVAATFDYDAGVYTLYWGNRTQEGKLRENSYNPENSFWIGTRSDSMNDTAQDLNIDEVRVYGRILDFPEIRTVSRNAPAHSGTFDESTMSSNTGALPGRVGNQGIGTPTGAPELATGEESSGRTVGQLPDELENPALGMPDDAPELTPSGTRTVGTLPDDIENPDVNRLPAGAPDLQYDSPEEAEAAARRRAENAEQETSPQTGSMAYQYRVQFRTDFLAYSGTSGGIGDYTEQMVDDVSRSRVPFWIETRENYDKPCTVYVHERTISMGMTSTEPEQSAREFDVCEEGLPRINPLTTLRRAINDPSAGEFGLITGIQVCNNGINKRVKGIRARVRDLRVQSGSYTYGANYTTQVFQERSNCVSWDEMAHCPANTYAVGLRLHFRDGDIVSPRDFLSGMELLCTDLQVMRSPDGSLGSWEPLQQGN